MRLFSFPNLFLLACFVLFNLTLLPSITLDVRNSSEASLFWTDEGIHVRSLEQFQETGSLQLVHQAYTSLYPHLSFIMSWFANGASLPIDSSIFVKASKFTSALMMNAYFLVILRMGIHVFPHIGWALGLVAIVMGLRINMMFGTYIHPDSTMLFLMTLALWWGWRFFDKGTWKYFWMACFSAGLAISAKPQVVFLIPWGGLVLLLSWKKYQWTIQQVLRTIGIGSIMVTLGFVLTSPYQVWHWEDWFYGLSWQSEFTQNSWASRSHWLWVSRMASGKYLGPIPFALSVFGLVYGIYHLYQKRETLKNVANWGQLESLYLLHALWLVVGGTYPLMGTTYIHRYLIHIQLSFLVLGWISLYWLIRQIAPQYQKKVLILVSLVLFAGAHDHWRNASKAIASRERVAENLGRQRDLQALLKQSLPQESRVLYTPREVYLNPEFFPNAELMNEFSFPSQWEKGFDYLIMHTKHRPGMRYDGLVANNYREEAIVETIKFWKALEQDQVNGQMKLLYDFDDVSIQVYQRISSH